MAETPVFLTLGRLGSSIGGSNAARSRKEMNRLAEVGDVGRVNGNDHRGSSFQSSVSWVVLKESGTQDGDIDRVSNRFQK